MPGIFGLSGRDVDNSRSAAIADRMVHRLSHQPWYQHDRFEAPSIVLGRVSLGFVNPGKQPVSNRDGSLLAVFDGEIYDAPAQRRKLAAAGRVCVSSSDGEILIQGYEAEGDRFLAGLHGKFVAALWDTRKRHLFLINDRFGMRPLYYAHEHGRLVFSSEIKAVLADGDVCRDRRLRGIAQFFTFGQLLAEDTFYENVQLLPAGSVLRYDIDEDWLSVNRYVSLTGHGQCGSHQEHLERIGQAFDSAVERSISGDGSIGLSLSGGLDARSILGAIPDDVPLTTVSIGMEGSMDHRLAAEMAEITGRTHHQCLLGEGFLDRFEEHLRRMVWLTDGHYLSQCIVMPTLPRYRELGIQFLLRGHAGELMHMTKAYAFSLDREALAICNEAQLEDWLFRHLQTYMLEGTEGKLFAPAYRATMIELARDSLQSCLRDSAHIEQPLQRIWHLFVTQRLRRETAMSLVKFGSLVETRLPLLDNELIEALFAAPPELKLDETIQTHILRKRRPEFLKVLNVNTGTRVDAGRIGHLIGKFRLKVLAKLGVRGYQPYERLGLWLRRELRPLVHKLLLNDQCLDRGLFDPQTVRKVVEAHNNGANHTFLLLAMMIYEMGQRKFVDEDLALEQSADVDSARVTV